MNRYKLIADLREALDQVYEAWTEVNHRLNVAEAQLLPQGLIDVDKKTNQWVLTCNECGEIGRFPVAMYEGKAPTEVAWDAHEQEHKERG